MTENIIISEITFNWRNSEQRGEEFECRLVGSTCLHGTLVKIEEHQAQGEGDKWFYDVTYSNGTIERIFNPNLVFFKQTTS